MNPLGDCCCWRFYMNVIELVADNMIVYVHMFFSAKKGPFFLSMEQQFFCITIKLQLL